MISQNNLQKVSFYCQYSSQIIVEEIDTKYNFLVKGFIAYHEIHLRYKNQTAQNQIVIFNFRLSEDTCFENLSVVINEKLITFNVLDKKQENQLDIIKEGSLSESQGNTSIQIGKIQKGKEFIICFKYVELLAEKEQNFYMNLPFYQEKLLQKVEINGDIYAQNSQDLIISAEFLDCFNLNQVKIQQVKNYHFKVNGELSQMSQGYFQQEKAQLKVQYSKNNISILSSNQKNSEISPYCAIVNFTPHQLQVKEPFITNTNDQLNKSEFILIIDRSQSMQGPKMELAKESLIFFLKSMPIGSIYNIISFGSTYEIMFDQSVQFNDQNVQNSIQKIDQFTANMGATNVSQALEYVYLNLNDYYGLQKKIFIITDGEFTDQKQTQEIVSKNQNRCNINALCIGQDIQFQQAIEIANKTRGFFQHVTNQTQIISKVMLLLSQSCQNLSNSIQMESSSDHDDCIHCILPNPKQITFIDRTKTLRFYIFLNKKFEDVKKINFKLTTTYQNNIKIEDNYIIDIQDQARQEDVNIYKVGLYQLIKQIIINQWRKCEDILENISHSFNFSQSNHIKLLKKEAIKFQILCGYTALAYQKQVKSNQQKPQQQKQQTIQKLFSCFKKQVQKHDKNNVMVAQIEDISQKYGDDVLKILNFVKQNPYFKVIRLQKINGLWEFSNDLLYTLNLSAEKFDKINPISNKTSNFRDIWITMIIIFWLQVFCNKLIDQHKFILKKAVEIIEKIKQEQFIKDTTTALKQLFENYRPAIIQLTL
ncbi:hypothetical protein ABPG74_018025 [Tetrahymena malaccensis]